MRVRLAATIAVLALAGATPAAAAPTLGHHGRWLTDPQGRAVPMHGVAVMDFGPAHLPAAQGFDRDDAAFVGTHGFDVVRVGFNWAGLEPQPGVVDGAYLGSIRKTVRQRA